MNFSVDHSTPKDCLSATSQAGRESGDSRKKLLSRQLTLWESSQKPASQSELFSRKPQISSIPGISPRERNRYRVTLGDKVIGDRLDLDEAIKVAKFGLRPSRGER
jgi:hypothetical protein